MNTLERLAELLNEKDQEIEKLSASIARYEAEEEALDWEWCRHSISEENHGNLPVPRLEIRCQQIGDTWYQYEWTYSLVYLHLIGQFITIPLGHTKCSGGGRKPDDLPFRDGAHIEYDRKRLNLPAYMIIGDDDPIELLDEDHQIILKVRDGGKDAFSRPCLINVETGWIYVDVSLGTSRVKRHNIPGAWYCTTDSGEPDGRLSCWAEFEIIE